MNKQLEELSKNLASGVSRRKAMWHFAVGLAGIAGLGVLTTKKASASNPFACIEEAETAYASILKVCVPGCLGSDNTNPFKQGAAAQGLSGGTGCDTYCSDLGVEAFELAYETCLST